nr:GNAT family N-acetyltransferase [uncultured Massilia sp.]
MTAPSLITLRLRPVEAADQPFVLALYRATRSDLLGMIADPRYIDALVAMQQRQQTEGFRSMYPDAAYHVLELDGKPVGRLVTAVAGDALRVVDIAVLPQARRRGVGSEALRRVQEQAAREGRDVTLAVRKDNAGARRLYASLGFTLDREESMLQLRWRRPGSAD